MHPVTVAAICAALLIAGCGPEVVSLGAAVPVTGAPPREIPLEVVTRGSGVADPLRLRGTSVAFAEVESSLGHAVATAAVPWADRHRDPDRRWQLVVELARASAARRGGRVTVAFDVRATLRARDGHRYLGQTQAHCREAAVAEEGTAAPVVYACMMSLGRELAGWLAGVDP